MGERADHPQVVADEQVAEAVACLKPAQEIDDLRLHRDVERAGRLVEHHQARLQHHRPRDRDALALPAAEFMRITVGGVG